MSLQKSSYPILYDYKDNYNYTNNIINNNSRLVYNILFLFILKFHSSKGPLLLSFENINYILAHENNICSYLSLFQTERTLHLQVLCCMFP
jgi:hypothetical protein